MFGKFRRSGKPNFLISEMNFLDFGRMDLRILLLVLALGISCGCNAKVVTTDIYPDENGIDSVLLQQINLQQQQESEVDVVEELRENELLCKLCQKIVEPVLKLLSDGSVQQKIKAVLLKICSLLPSNLMCNLKIEAFLQAFALQVAVLTPKTLCITIKLCDLIPIPPHHPSQDSYESCRDLVAEVSLKLKDPNTQLKTTEVLMKGCDVLEDFEGLAEKCKTLVYSYAPLILHNAEQFFESYGVCGSAPYATEKVNSAF